MKFKQSPLGFKNVRGPLVQSVQAQLNAKGFNAGTADDVWGNNTITALRAWQSANGINPSGEIDDQTWTQLMGRVVPEMSQRALQLTGDWEGTGYGGANGNFDGQGITWGVVGFTWRNGELQDILKEIQAQYPAIFAQAFGALTGHMQDILVQPRAAQMDFARSISRNNGNAIEQSWSAAFKALGDVPEVQAIEDRHAQHYWDSGAHFAVLFGLQTEMGQSLCFDIAVQNTVTDAMIAEIQNKIGAHSMTEPEMIQIIAHVVADHANPTYYSDVLKRKITFATGQGKVHGDFYDIGCWGIG